MFDVFASSAIGFNSIDFIRHFNFFFFLLFCVGGIPLTRWQFLNQRKLQFLFFISVRYVAQLVHV